LDKQYAYTDISLTL